MSRFLREYYIHDIDINMKYEIINTYNMNTII